MRSDMPAEDGFDTIFETMPFKARAEVRRRILAQVASDAAARHVRFANIRAIAVFLSLSLAGPGVAYASSVAAPGDPFYPVKVAAEEISIASVPEGPMRETLIQRVAVRRAREVAELARGGAGDASVGAAVGRFERAASRALEKTDDVNAARAQERLRETVDDVPEPAKKRAEKALTKAVEKRAAKADKARGTSEPSRKAQKKSRPEKDKAAVKAEKSK